MVNVAEVVRRTVIFVLMDSSSAVLDALGLKTSALERCREGFFSGL